MSKSGVPEVYARVITDVIEASRIDFEEGGVDLGALELLKQGWQKRLSNENIAQFPWDPKPEPVQKQEAPNAPSNVKPPPATLPSNGTINTPAAMNTPVGPQIKQENQQYVPQPPLQSNYQRYPQTQQISPEARAAELLQQRYGDQAGRSIAQLQNSAQNVPPAAQRTPQQPPIKQEFKQEDAYHQNWQAGQVDGAADEREEYEAEIAYRKSLTAQHREAGDRLIREYALASQKSLEGGGLLMPLNEQFTSKAAKASKKSSLARAQGDAAGDEDDEDAINSDLDDPNDLDENDGDDANVANVMLCTYDKVQRVKNKWKCTLKDGILKVDGAEFVFHKGQGEFEW